jgi:antitoxin CptB
LSALPGHLLWRCRRGTKELDVLLERYAIQRYPHASAAERVAFHQILDLPDPLLTDYLFGHEPPQPPAIAHLIEQIARPAD